MSLRALKGRGNLRLELQYRTKIAVSFTLEIATPVCPLVRDDTIFAFVYLLGKYLVFRCSRYYERTKNKNRPAYQRIGRAKFCRKLRENKGFFGHAQSRKLRCRRGQQNRPLVTRKPSPCPAVLVDEQLFYDITIMIDHEDLPGSVRRIYRIVSERI